MSVSTAPATPATPSEAERIAAVRRFNRFYTRQIGVLDEGLLQSPFSLTEVRILYELAHRDGPTASELGKALRLDAGYVSRLLRSLEERGLISREASDADARQSHLALTRKGRTAFAQLDERSERDVAAMLGALLPSDQQRLLAAMRTIETVLAGSPDRNTGAPYLLRDPRAGDFGWVVQRHGVLYADEYGWDERFEALVARIVADFVEHYDGARERCWIAERDGQNVGSVFLVRHPDERGVAKLRLLLVEPSARGLGIGRRLVSECTQFARHTGYRTITLWTNSVLVSARGIYEAEGYRLVGETPHRSFGPELVGQTWELAL